MTDRSSQLSNTPRPTPLDITAFVPYACLQLEAPFRVIMSTQIKKEYVSVNDKLKKGKREKSTMRSMMHSSMPRASQEKETSESALTTSDAAEGVAARIAAVCDAAGHCVELLLARTLVPALLVRIIGCCFPYQPHLGKIAIRRATVDGYAIHELAKQLRQAQHITELYLDDTPVMHRNQHVLLDFRTQLKCLSLDRCRLDDADCAALAARLAYPRPASSSLCILSLASNFISDAGAVALGTMLRSNRRLRHLNLSGNRVSDLGAAHIFGSLVRFPMTYEEITSKRSRNMKYIKLQKEVYSKCYAELRTISAVKSLDDRGSGKRRPAARVKRRSTTALAVAAEPLSVEDVAAKAESMAREIVGPYDDPFKDKYTVREAAYSFSIGNFCLTYLNMAHNNLGRESLLKLLEVMKYQAEKTDKPHAGLVKVVVEGNPLPVAGKVLEALQDLCDLAAASPPATSHKSEKFKSLKLNKK